MASNTTGTYKQAKDIYNNTALMQDVIITVIDSNIVRIFRKHLSEFEYRQKQGKQFTSKILDETRLLVKRIK